MHESGIGPYGIAHSTRREAQGRFRTSDAGSRQHARGIEARLPASGVAAASRGGMAGMAGGAGPPRRLGK